MSVTVVDCPSCGFKDMYEDYKEAKSDAKTHVGETSHRPRMEEKPDDYTI